MTTDVPWNIAYLRQLREFYRSQMKEQTTEQGFLEARKAYSEADERLAVAERRFRAAHVAS